MAFFRYARLSTPMIRVKLTASPISTMIMRPLTLDAMLRLSRLITKPRNVISNPRKIMLCSPLFLVVFPRFAFQEQHDGRAQREQSDHNRDVIDVRGEPGGDQ